MKDNFMCKKIIFIYIIFSAIIFSQPSFFLPKQPKVNQTLEVYYNPFDAKARFSINDNVYVIIQLTNQNGDNHVSSQKMEKRDSLYFTNIYIDINAAAFQLYFITLSENSLDFSSSLRIAVFNNNNLPVENAYYDNFEKENENYPNNFAVYRNKWFPLKFIKSDSYKEEVKKDLKFLANVNDTSVGLLYSLSYGYLLLDEYQTSYNIIERMVSEYPQKGYTFSAISSFIYELSTNNIKSSLINEINSLAESLVMKEINLPDAWMLVGQLNTNVFSDSCILQICKEWINIQPENPEPYSLLSYVLARITNDDYNLEQITKQFISLTLEGKSRLYDDISGKQVLFKLSSGYYRLAEIYFAKNNYCDAISAIQSAIGIDVNPSDKMFLLKGDIWFKLFNYKLAEESYLKAWVLGSLSAKDKIFECYKRTNNIVEGFAKYFDEKTNTKTNELTKKDNQLESAPELESFLLDGKKISSKEFNGKVIVLNFWFTSCGPCKQEIPELNELVEKYKNKNVVFLAFALDKDKQLLNKYIKHNPFSYDIIPDAGKIAEEYKVTAYPTHIIINKDGKVVARIIGGGEGIKSSLTNIIDNNI
jgi:thiol-disulfide isomerase/thioredoxin